MKLKKFTYPSTITPQATTKPAFPSFSFIIVSSHKCKAQLLPITLFSPNNVVFSESAPKFPFPTASATMFPKSPA